MSKFIMSSAVVVLSLGMASGAVIAADSPSSSSPRSSSSPGMSSGTGTSASSGFKSLDANGDGYISKDEAQGSSNLSLSFDKVDADGDSRLDEGEFAQFEVTEQKEMAPGSAPSDSAPSGGSSPGR